MIGSGLKKYAEENGLKVAKGVGYGSLQGFAVTLSEGSGYKQAVFVTKFSADSESDALIEKLNAANIQRNYRVQNLSITPETVQVVFTDNPGTMKKIREFMDWFLPLLQEHGASQYNVCPECGGQIASGKWILINGVAFYMHDACAEKTKRSIAETEEAEKLLCYRCGGRIYRRCAGRGGVGPCAEHRIHGIAGGSAHGLACR